MNQAELLAKAARSFGERPAVSEGGAVRLSYAELAARVARIAGGLRGLGLAPGDRVALAMKNCPAYFELLYGAWHAGCAASPINAKLHPREFAYILENNGARVCFVTDDLAEAIAPLVDEIPTLERVIVAGSPEHRRLQEADAIALHPMKPDDLAWLFYTSGTTGRPKGAMLTCRNLIAMLLNYLADIDPEVRPEDSLVHAAPISHGGGLIGLSHFARGANNVVPESGGYDVAETLELIRRWPRCNYFMAPTMITRFVNAYSGKGVETPNLKTIVYGGAPMYVEDTIRALDVLGPVLVQLYGQGESPNCISYLPKWMHADRGHPRWQERLGSVGIVRTNVLVRICDSEDRDLPVGETGEILVQGDTVMAGYWRNDKASADTLRGGWLHTGDVGAFDEFGFLALKDRSKDMIISGGTNIYPREIEEVLLRHDAVQECAVIGRRHPDWGEEPIAYIVARPGRAVTPAELDRLCLDNIARFKRPKDYRFIEALPKNNSGKILKTELRALLAKEGGRG
jgi:acyl-CoA synthetase (AMP-forming)/AMP-acid ligase II